MHKLGLLFSVMPLTVIHILCLTIMGSSRIGVLSLVAEIPE